MNFLWTLLISIIVIYGIYWLAHWIMRKRSASLVSNEELQAVIRKVQLIDVRPEAEYRANHILGARNIPGNEFKQRINELRKDVPVYLYDDGMNQATRAANKLRKAGYSDVYILENGFSGWYGSKKSLI